MRHFTLFLAFKHVRRRPLQSTLTVLGVAVGVMVLIVALSLTNGFIAELLRSTLRATPHVTLQSYLATDLLDDDPAVLAALAAHPEVEAAAPYLGATALIARRASRSLGVSGRGSFTQIVGIDPGLEAAVLDLPILVEQREALERERGIVLGGSLAAGLGVIPDDEVFVRDITNNSASLTVAGEFRVGNELIDAVTSYMALANLQAFLGVEGEITGYHVRLQDPADASRMALVLGERFGLRPFSWENIFIGLVSQLRLQKAVISAVVFLIVLVAAMGIANILVLTVSEKTEEIAILRALGASQRQILSVFTLEGLLLGGTGTLLGVGLGLALSLYFRYQPYPLPGDLYFITQLPVEIQPLDILWTSGLSLVTSVLAGLFPARRASNLKPVEVLR